MTSLLALILQGEMPISCHIQCFTKSRPSRHACHIPYYVILCQSVYIYSYSYIVIYFYSFIYIKIIAIARPVRQEYPIGFHALLTCKVT